MVRQIFGLVLKLLFFFFLKLTDLMISLALNFRTKVFVIVFLSLHLKSREELPGRGGSIFLLP